MFKVGSKLYSVTHFKCPRCHQGDLYINQNPYSSKNFFDMHEKCEHCAFRYEREPGYFYGAMYVSYGLSIMIVGLIWAILTLLGFDFWVVIWTMIPALILSIPILFKISRAIWLNLFTHFDPKYKL